MVDLIVLSPMAKQQRVLDAVQNYGKRLFRFIRSRVQSDEDEDGELSYPESLLADDANPETELERAFFREQLFAALNELPQKQRDVFVWNELEEMTLQQIADQTGDNIKTIISRKRYAVAHLREWLQNLYNK